MLRFALPRLRDRLALRHRPDDPSDDAQAAVAAVLRPAEDGAEVLLIKRADRIGDPWSGHLAFPGGKREPFDASLFATSVRETQEEVGLALPAASFVARLEDVRARTNGYKVAEFVFALDPPVGPLTTNEEVRDTMWVSLERIAREQGKETMPWVIGDATIQLPCVRLGAYVLWGMTLRMVTEMIESVL
jgi:8-oxo-dGTP pyrophosphatase MutT (NUDIX family)